MSSDPGELSSTPTPASAPSATPSPQPKPTPQSYEQRRQAMDRTRADNQRAAATPNPRAGRDAPDPNTSFATRHVATEARRKELGVGEPAAPNADAGAGNDGGGLQTSPPTPSDKIKIDDAEYGAQELRDALAERAVRRSRELTRPQKAEDFKLATTPNFQPPAGLDFKLDPDDPAVGMYRAFALKNGFTQDQFTEGLDLVASLRVGEAHAVSKAKAAEVAKLGAAGTQRIDTVTTWLAAMTGDNGAAMVRVLQMCPVADTIVAFESLMQRFQTQGAGAYTPTGRRVETPSGQIPGYETMTFEQRRAAQESLRRK
jgi:hypothetical protein